MILHFTGRVGREARCRENRVFELQGDLCHPNSGRSREVLKLVIQPHLLTIQCRVDDILFHVLVLVIAKLNTDESIVNRWRKRRMYCNYGGSSSSTGTHLLV